MFFSELYGTYYQAVARVLEAAVDHPLEQGELSKILQEQAFGESRWNMESALREERWQLLLSDGSTVLHHAPTLPLTKLEKQWLMAIRLDPRIRLFGSVDFEFPEVEPLFLPKDYRVIDSYSDGDDYEDEGYIQRFRFILDAIREKFLIVVVMRNQHGKLVRKLVQPESLEYSEKDDKFRLIAKGRHYGCVINLGRILLVERYEKNCEFDVTKEKPVHTKKVLLELVDERNALERVLMHFAHFEKRAERIDEDRYRVWISYDESDEPEMIIRILAFGPVVQVTEPSDFVIKLRQRLMAQRKWLR